MRAVPVIAMQPFWQIGGSFARMAISSSIGPFAQCGLNEPLGFAIGAWRVKPGEDMPQAPTATDRCKRQRAKHPGVVRHDATYPYAEVRVIARGVIEERRRASLALVGEHLDKPHARTIVNRHEGGFPASASNLMLAIAG